MDVTAFEATNISDKDSEELAVDAFPDILVDGRKVLDCPQHCLRLVKSAGKTSMDLKDDKRACLAYVLSRVPDSPNRQPPMLPVSRGANAHGIGTHRPISEGVQGPLLRGREHAQVMVHTAIVVTVVANDICQSGGGFFSLARELFHLK